MLMDFMNNCDTQSLACLELLVGLVQRLAFLSASSIVLFANSILDNDSNRTQPKTIDPRRDLETYLQF